LQNEAKAQADEANDVALTRVSETIDAFCADDTNFHDDGFSRKGSFALTGLLTDGLAAVTEAAFYHFLKPRLAILVAHGALDETNDGHGATTYRVKGLVDDQAVQAAWKATGSAEPWFPDVTKLMTRGARPTSAMTL
jgi:hypothetical protein